MSVALLLLALEGHAAGVQTLVEGLLISFEHAHSHLGVLVVADGRNFLLLRELSLDGLEVFKL